MKNTFAILLALILFGGWKAGAQQITTRTAMTYVGTYSATSSYTIGDVVQYGSSSYVSIISMNRNNEPDLAPSDWRLLSSAGGASSWGSIGGTITSQTDLASALAGKAASNASIKINNVNCTLSGACSIPVGTGGSTVNLQHGGAPNGSQTTLNLIAGSNLSLTDDGQGNLTYATNPFSAYTWQPTAQVNESQISGNNQFYSNLALTGGGMNRGPMANNAFVSGWSGGDSYYIDNYLSQRGITHTMTFAHRKRAAGDDALLYGYQGIGGGCGMAAADEGCGSISMQLFDFAPPQGTISVGGVGNVTPTLQVTSGDSGTVDQSDLLDITAGTISGSFAATSLQIQNGTSGSPTGLPNVTVSGVTLPLTTAWGNITTNVVDTGLTPDHQSGEETYTVAVQSGTFNTGWAIIAGPEFAEQIHIDSVTASSSPNAGAGTPGSITVGQNESAASFGSGATDGNFSVTFTSSGAGSQEALFLFPFANQSWSPTCSVVSISPTNSTTSAVTVTATPINGSLDFVAFAGTSGLTAGTYTLVGKCTGVSGSSGMQQTITFNHHHPHSANAVILQGGLSSGEQFLSSDEVANITASLPAYDSEGGSRMTAYHVYGSLTGSDLIYGLDAGTAAISPMHFNDGVSGISSTGGFHLYPGAEIVANLSVNANPQLEPNPWPWTAGHAFYDPHPNAFAVDELYFPSHLNIASNENSYKLFMHYDGIGASGAYHPIWAENGNPCSLYQGCGGTISGPTMVSLLGPHDTFANLDGILPGGTVINIPEEAGVTNFAPISLFKLLGKNINTGYPIPGANVFSYNPTTGNFSWTSGFDTVLSAPSLTTIVPTGRVISHVFGNAATSGNAGLLGWVPASNGLPAFAQLGTYYNASPVQLEGSGVTVEQSLHVGTGTGDSIFGGLCASGIALCVNPNSTATVDTAGNAIFNSITCVSTPCGSGSGGSSTNATTVNGAAVPASSQYVGTDANNHIVTAPAPESAGTAAALEQAQSNAGYPGYVNPVPYAKQRTRDAQLSDACLTPATYNASAFGTNQNGDDREAWNLALLEAGGSTNLAPNVQVATVTPDSGRTVCGQGHKYRVLTPGGYALLPRDMGDYLGSNSWASGGTSQTFNAGQGATVALTFDTQGSIATCTAVGGSSYNPNSYLPVKLEDVTHIGSGGAIYLTTDSTGTPNTCVIQQKGRFYPRTGGSVQATVFPAGADGANGTCTLSSGTLTGCTVGAGGNGYTGTVSAGFYHASTALACSTYPTATTTVSGGAVTAINVGTAGTGCQYNGNTSATVPVLIGASVGGVQATNLAPETANEIPIGILVRPNTTIDCQGGELVADWAGKTVDLNQMVPIGDPFGDQAHDITIRNCKVLGIWGMYFAGTVRNLWLDNDTFGSGTTTVGTGGNGGVYIGHATGGVRITNSVFLGRAGVVCGGGWYSRTGGSGGGLGSIGGTDLSYKTANSGDSCDQIDLSSNQFYQQNANPAQATSYTNGFFSPPNGVYGNSINTDFDKYFEQYWWKSQNSAVASSYAINGTGNCTITTTAAVRGIDSNWGNSQQIWPCYHGVTDTVLTAFPRYWYVNKNVTVDTLYRDNGQRPLIQGAFTSSDFSRLFQPNGPRTYTDAYTGMTASTLGAVNSEVPTTQSNNKFTTISVPNMVRGFSSYTAGALDCVLVGCTGVNYNLWSGITASGTTQANYGSPGITSALSFSPGSIAAQTCAYTSPSGANGSVALGDRVASYNIPSSQTAGITITPPSVINSHNISVQYCNITGAAVTPVAETITVTTVHQ